MYARFRTLYQLILVCPCLKNCCYAFDKINVSILVMLIKLRTYINILLYQTIFNKNIAYLFRLRDLLAYDAVRQARRLPRLSGLAGPNI